MPDSIGYRMPAGMGLHTYFFQHKEPLVIYAEPNVIHSELPGAIV